MHIVLVATGTRGDVQPIIALGLGLKAAGHHIRIVAGSNFVQWIESFGLEAYPTMDMEALMRSEAGISWVESANQRQQLRAMKTLLDTMGEPMSHDFIEGTRDADLIVGGFVSEPFMLSIQEKRGVPLVTAALQPYRPTRSGAASLVSVRPNTTSVFNRAFGWVGEQILWQTASHTSALVRRHLDLPPMTISDYRRAVRPIPALYGFSPAVVPPPNDVNAYTTGYWFLDEPFTPSDELVKFIQTDTSPVYFGFGSMSSSDPSRTLTLISETLKRVGRRGIIAQGWSGLNPSDLPDHIFLLDKAPHSWLFPQMAAVVHHGGAGTTGAGLRAGVPSLLIPHMGDQPYWAHRLPRIGVSVKAIPRKRLTVDLLTDRLSALLNDSGIRSRAAALGETIRAERGVENAVEWINARHNPAGIGSRVLSSGG